MISSMAKFEQYNQFYHGKAWNFFGNTHVVKPKGNCNFLYNIVPKQQQCHFALIMFVYYVTIVWRAFSSTHIVNAAVTFLFMY